MGVPHLVYLELSKKFPGYDVYVDYDQIGFAELSFNTAWAAPIQVFEALSLLFPSTLINVAYAYEGSVTSSELITYLDGLVVSRQGFYEANTCPDKWVNLWKNIKKRRCVSFEYLDNDDNPSPKLEGYFAI